MYNPLINLLVSKQHEIIKEYYSRDEKSQSDLFCSKEVPDQKWVKQLLAALNTAEHAGLQSLENSGAWRSKADQLIRVIISCIAEELKEQLKKDNKEVIGELARICGSIYVELYGIGFQEKLNSYRKNEQHLLSSIVSAQENERRRLASILHDDVMQSIAGLLIRVNALQREYKNEQVNYELTEMTGILRNMVQSCRFVNFQTDSLWVEKTGFLPALDIFINNYMKKNEIFVEMECNEFAHKLTKTVETHFFRVIQEALQNIKKHAHASHIKIKLRNNGKTAFLSVQDNGSGFDYQMLRQELSKKAVKDHFGILSIEHRSRLLGGKLIVRSEPGKGTVLSVIIPLDNEVHKQQDASYNGKVSTWVKYVKASLCNYRS